MNLQEQIKNDMGIAMKSRETEKLMLLRVVSGEITLFSKSKDIMKRQNKEITNDDVIKIVRKMSNDAKEMSNLSEVEILNEYLPQMLSEEHIRLIVSNIIETNGFSNMKDMGNVMRTIKSHPDSSLIDGKISSRITRELLG